MTPRIGWDAVLAGATVALVVAAVTLMVVQVVDAVVGVDGGSNWVFVFYAVMLGGFVVGGRRAAQRRADAPIVHGVAAALTAYAVVAAVGSALRLVVDGGPDPVALVFNALIAACTGIVGGLWAGPPAGAANPHTDP